MKKSTLSFFIFFLLIVNLLLPSVTMAAWWNPLSWFKKTSVNVQQNQIKININSYSGKNATSTLSINKTKTKQILVPQLKQLTNSQIIKKVKPAVVYIKTDTAAGSGMIFTTDGYILTNAHVVKDATNVNVSLSTGDIISGVVIGRDEVADLAVIKLNSNLQFPKIDFGDSNKTEQGEEVFTFGFPFGIEGDVSFKEGTISRRIEGYFETSAEIHPGNSGGPLVNKYGQVIGINTAIFGKSISDVQLGETIKLAIPINTAQTLIPDLKAGKIIIDEKAQIKEAEVTAKKNEEQKRIEDAKKETERIAAEVAAKQAEEKKRIEEENARIEAQILVTQQCVQNKKVIVAEYNTKKLNLEQQINNRKSKYYADYAALTESFKGRGVTTSAVQGQYDRLLSEANREIDLLNLELDKLYVEYSSKLNQFQC